MFKFLRKGSNQVLKVVVGLGNPGKDYAQTRHNIGFMAIDYLAEQYGTAFRSKFQAQIGEKNSEGGKVLLLKPQTYMNLSGRSVAEVLAWYKLSPENVIVIYDDMDLPFGKIRLRAQGSPGGHNGIKSIVQELGTQKFDRIKIGIGRPSPGRDPVDFVLGKFPISEQQELAKVLQGVSDAVEDIIANGIVNAMNKHNS